MKIRMNTAVAITRAALARGQVAEVPDNVGAALVKAGHAEQLGGTPAGAPDEFTGLKVPELRAELEKRGLETTGKKPELLARLREAAEHDDDPNGDAGDPGEAGEGDDATPDEAGEDAADVANDDDQATDD